MDAKTQEIYNAVLDGNAPGAQAAVKAVLDEGLDPARLLNEDMIAAMKEVGKRFEEGDYYVPEMLIAARAMQSGMALPKPHLTDAGIQPVGKVALGTVKGDLHDTGKNLVGMMVEGPGFKVKDLGVDVAPETFVSAAEEVDVIGLSALLTTIMGSMKTTLEALDAAGKRPKVKVIVGGAPVTEDFARQIGADGYAPIFSHGIIDEKKAQVLRGIRVCQ